MSEIRTSCNDSCPYYYKNTGCLKPDGLFCPPMSTTVREVPYNDYANYYTNHNIIMNTTSMLAKKCIICGESIQYNSQCDEVVCDECKEAIKRLKENKNETNDNTI